MAREQGGLVRVLRVMEYTYPDLETARRDRRRWAVGANSEADRGNVSIASRTFEATDGAPPLVHMPVDTAGSDVPHGAIVRDVDDAHLVLDAAGIDVTASKSVAALVRILVADREERTESGRFWERMVRGLARAAGIGRDSVEFTAPEVMDNTIRDRLRVADAYSRTRAIENPMLVALVEDITTEYRDDDEPMYLTMVRTAPDTDLLVAAIDLIDGSAPNTKTTWLDRLPVRDAPDRRWRELVRAAGIILAQAEVERRRCASGQQVKGPDYGETAEPMDPEAMVPAPTTDPVEDPVPVDHSAVETSDPDDIPY